MFNYQKRDILYGFVFQPKKKNFVKWREDGIDVKGENIENMAACSPRFDTTKYEEECLVFSCFSHQAKVS